MRTKPFIAAFIRMYRHNRIFQTFDSEKMLLDFFDFNAVTSYFYLLVFATDIFDLPVRQPFGQIS
ncbi:hypothetical protein D3C85_1622950 [compost metagenome]